MLVTALSDVLSSSDEDVLRALLDGQSIGEIAQRRGTDAKTIRNQRAVAKKKLLGAGFQLESNLRIRRIPAGSGEFRRNFAVLGQSPKRAGGRSAT